MEYLKDFINESYCISSVLACIFITFMYVGSLYVWRSNLSRDHPTTIKRRFFSVSCMMVVTPFFCQYFMSESSLARGDIYEQLGLRVPGILPAIVIPLFLTIVLFLGPLTMQFLSGGLKMYIQPMYWFTCWRDLVWVRNYFMAPLSEEWVFRACMLPILVQCLHPMNAVFFGPFLFGFAHFHHMYEQIKTGYNWKSALLISVFQFTYTSIFGAYSAYLFLRTGHFMAPLLAHIFCNHMGFPNFGEIPEYPLMQRLIIICNYLLGFTAWCYMLVPLTNPEIYDNRLHWQV